MKLYPPAAGHQSAGQPDDPAATESEARIAGCSTFSRGPYSCISCRRAPRSRSSSALRNSCRAPSRSRRQHRPVFHNSSCSDRCAGGPHAVPANLRVARVRHGRRADELRNRSCRHLPHRHYPERSLKVPSPPMCGQQVVKVELVTQPHDRKDARPNNSVIYSPRRRGHRVRRRPPCSLYVPPHPLALIERPS